jgi:hypothetical protein
MGLSETGQPRLLLLSTVKNIVGRTDNGAADPTR